VVRKRANRQTPLRFQSDVSECGAVALSIILEYFGVWVPLYEVRRACAVARDGTSALDIIKAAKNYGLKAKALRTNPQNLKRTPLPCIVLWKSFHYLVVESIEDERVLINDPERGRRALTAAEFRRGYSGLSIHFVASDRLSAKPRQRAETRLMAVLRSKSSRAALAFALGCALVIAVMDAVSPFFLKYIVERTSSNIQAAAVRWAVMLALVGVARLGVTIVTSHVRKKLYVAEALAHSDLSVARVLELPLSFFQARTDADILAKLRIGETIIENAVEWMLPMLGSALTATVYIAVACALYPIFGVSVFAMALMSAAFYFIVSGLRREWNLVASHLAIDASQQTKASIQGFLMMKANGAEMREFIRWSERHDVLANLYKRLQVSECVIEMAPNVIAAGISSIVVLLCLSQANRALAHAATGVTVIAVCTLVIASVSKITTYVDSRTSLDAAIERYEDIALEPAEQEQALGKDTTLLDSERCLLKVSNVRFGYGRVAVLSDISFTLIEQEHLAIAGRSGCGKSTLAALLSGNLSPQAGSIRHGGLSSRSLGRKQGIVLVEQRPWVFKGTLRENLTLGDHTISDRELDDIVSATRLNNVLSRFHRGADHRITSSSVLSGGECQRIHLARAILRRPRVLILDEATAAIDEATEAAIFGYLRSLSCTLIVVAHRLSALKSCQRGLVLSGGKICESGTISQLLEMRGEFWRLVKDQL